MTIKGYQFDRETVTPMADARLLDYLARGASGVLVGYDNNMAVTPSGLSVTVATGAALIKGRFVEIQAPETIAIPANTTGWLVLKVDLSLANQSSGDVGTSSYTVVNNQLSLVFVPTTSGLDIENINNGGTIYMLSLGGISSTGTTVTFTKDNSKYLASNGEVELYSSPLTAGGLNFGAITLAETAANFKCLEVFFCGSASQGYPQTSLRVVNPDGKRISMIVSALDSGGITIGCRWALISGVTISGSDAVNTGAIVYPNNTVYGTHASGFVAIHRVIGYR